MWVDVGVGFVVEDMKSGGIFQVQLVELVLWFLVRWSFVGYVERGWWLEGRREHLAIS